MLLVAICLGLQVASTFEDLIFMGGIVAEALQWLYFVELVILCLVRGLFTILYGAGKSTSPERLGRTLGR